MNSKKAYVTSIPSAAIEQVKATYADGATEQAEYYLSGERVGERSFHPSGELRDEHAFRNGLRQGRQYRWDTPGRLISAEAYENGVPHGTACQWADDGRLIGTYTMEHGTGIDLWWQDWPDGSAELAEVLYLQQGKSHGFEWWLNDDQRSVYIERHWFHGVLHGIEREWNSHGRLRRGFPHYWFQNKRVTKAQYRKAAVKDQSLQPFRDEDNLPRRVFPPEVAAHLSPGKAEVGSSAMHGARV